MPKQANIIGLYDNPDFSAPIEYTLELIFSIYGESYKVMPFSQFKSEKYNPAGTLVISYGREYLDSGAGKQIHIYASDFFGKDYLKPASMPETPLEKCDDLPVIYQGQGNINGGVRKSEGLIETNIDIIASSFFMLSRYEEIVLDVKDEHERFPAKASLAYKEGFLHRPVVNEYIELLRGWIKSLKPELERRPVWPKDKKFAVCLTHDVDYLKRYSLLPPAVGLWNAVLQRRNLRLGFNIASDYLGTLFHLRKDPFDTFDYMLSLEQKYGFSSSFYFVAGGNSKVGVGYSVKKADARTLVQKIEGGGCEVGLHAGYDSYDSLEEMIAEKEALDKAVKNKSYGCRQHFLRWRTPQTWLVQEQAGLLYDTTLTFADHAGFRCGICLPFQPFDAVENRKLDIWELPLTIMEGSLQNPNYQNLSPEEAREEIIKHIEMVKKFSGVFVLLWHNSSFDPLSGWGGWKEVYEDVIKYIADSRNAWLAHGREIVDWWRGQTAHEQQREEIKSRRNQS